MASKKNTTPVRLDPIFNNTFFIEIARARVKNNLELKTISPREISRMIMNAESTPFLIKELKTKPRKK